VLNAVERLVGAYDLERSRATRDLGIAKAQRRDFESRLGARFEHEGYLDELTSLRNQLELGLSGTEPVDGIVERIMALRAAHTVESAPTRAVRAATTEEPITARIRDRTQPQTEPAAPADTEVPAPLSPASPLTTLFNLPHQPKPQRPHARPSRPRPRREASSQLSLF
jgi:hypothetical protein